ncbi:L-type lectin-domain containing receptor kinase IX.1-like protein [Tanacetum coccineum]
MNSHTGKRNWRERFPAITNSEHSGAWNGSLHSGDDPAEAWISYNATTQMIILSWRYATYGTSRKNNTLSYQVDLRDVLPEWVTIGFSATTGASVERHILRSWEFSSSLITTHKREVIAGYAMFQRTQREDIQNLLEMGLTVSFLDSQFEVTLGSSWTLFKDGGVFLDVGYSSLSAPIKGADLFYLSDSGSIEQPYEKKDDDVETGNFHECVAF